MKTPKIELNKSSNDSGIADDTNEENSEKKGAGRRLLDNLISKDPDRHFNVDRRAKGSERRRDTDSNYNGPVRRYTIDRRLNLKDRRDKG